MSEDKGEENENGVKDLSDEFEFYFSFTKPLVLELPSSEERAIAAAWVQKLETETEDKERLNYLKLLLFILQRGRLSGIFKKQPPSGPFEPFPQGFSIVDMGNLMLDQDDGQMFGGGDARALPYNVEISNDLREFVASQEVPNFGIQMYYAWSADDPIQKWAAFDEDKFPQFILDKIKQLKEVSSEEKTGKDSCGKKKKGYDLNRSDKYSKKKVKSPQEIEKSQGRSFHTYMGLVGRMGNFSKCDDDQDRFQKQDPRRGGKPQRKNMQRRVPGSGGEAEDMGAEDDYENLVTGLGGGLTSANRPCLCPYPCHHQDCPESRKGGPQPSNNQRANVTGSPESGCSPLNGTVRQTSAKGGMREQCTEPEGVTSMQRCAATSAWGPESPGRPNCPEDNKGVPPAKGGICVCSSPPCTCPCPRFPSGKPPSFGGAATKAAGPSPAGGANAAMGRVCSPQTRTVMKPSQPDPNCGGRFAGKPGGEFLTSLKVPDNYMDRQTTPTNTPVGGRSCASSGMKPVRPISHCYDERNPDPCLTEVIARQPSMMAASPYVTPPGPPPPEVSFKSRRQLFTPVAESTVVNGPFPQQSEINCSTIPPFDSPELMMHAECENDLPGSDTLNFQQNFMGSDDDCVEPYPNDPCEGGVANTYKKQMKKVYNTPVQSQANRSLFAVEEGAGRLANIASVLQGLQQKTEAHRERCAAGAMRKTPEDNGVCPANIQTMTQVKSYPSQMPYEDGGMAGNYSDECSPQDQPDPNAYFTPQPSPRENPCVREVQTVPAKKDEMQHMFLSNQLGYQGPTASQMPEYFPVDTPPSQKQQRPSPQPQNLVRYDTYTNLDQCGENEAVAYEEECQYESSSDTYYGDQNQSPNMIKAQSAPCPTTESFFFSPPRARQPRENMSHYTPPQGSPGNFQSCVRPQAASPGNRSSPSGNTTFSPQQRSPGGVCRPQPQMQPQPQPRPQECKPPVNVNFLTPQHQPPNRGNLRPQAFSTGGKYKTMANINCPRPQRQPISQRMNNDQYVNNMQGNFGMYDPNCGPEIQGGNYVEQDNYDPNADMENCEPMPPC